MQCQKKKKNKYFLTKHDLYKCNESYTELKWFTLKSIKKIERFVFKENDDKINFKRKFYHDM